jgi:hypothetical protein
MRRTSRSTGTGVIHRHTSEDVSMSFFGEKRDGVTAFAIFDPASERAISKMADQARFDNPDGGGLASSSASRLCQWASVTCRVCYGPSRKLSAVPIAPLRSARSGRTRARTRTPISTASRCCARPTAGREDVIVPSA